MPGKDSAIVIDHVHNIQNPDGSINLGFPDDIGRIWGLDRIVKRKQATDEIQVKICISCTLVYDIGSDAMPLLWVCVRSIAAFVSQPSWR